MIQQNQKLLKIVFFYFDGLCIYISLAIAYLLRFVLFAQWFLSTDTHLPFKAYSPVFFGLLIITWTLYQLWGLYEAKRTKSVLEEFGTITKANLVSLVAIFGFLFLIKESDFSRMTLCFYVVTNIILSSLMRYAVRFTLRKIRKSGYNTKRLLLIGTGHTARMFVKKIRSNPHFGFQICGVLSDQISVDKRFLSNSVLGKIEDLYTIAQSCKPDEIVAALELNEYPVLSKIIPQTEKLGIKIHIIPAYYRFLPSNPVLEDLDGLPMLTLRKIPLTNWFYAAVKRLFDISVACVCLLLFSPILIGSFLTIKFTTSGSAIFRQERIGLNGKPFFMYKFRSMDNASSSVGWTTKGDQRRTPFGKFIRKWSIDELPQFWNVLKGDMSIVGPRPEQECFVQEFKEEIPRYMVKHQVKPGITGFAQIRGLRGDTSILERIEADLYYIENWSLLLDIKIILKTVLGGFYNSNE